MAKQKNEKNRIGSILEKAIIDFVEYHPVKRVNRNLRIVWMEYLEHVLSGCPAQAEDKIYDISSLMELLDAVEDETKGWHKD